MRDCAGLCGVQDFWLKYAPRGKLYFRGWKKIRAPAGGVFHVPSSKSYDDEGISSSVKTLFISWVPVFFQHHSIFHGRTTVNKNDHYHCLAMGSWNHEPKCLVSKTSRKYNSQTEKNNMLQHRWERKKGKKLLSRIFKFWEKIPNI